MLKDLFVLTSVGTLMWAMRRVMHQTKPPTDFLLPFGSEQPFYPAVGYISNFSAARVAYPSVIVHNRFLWRSSIKPCACASTAETLPGLKVERRMVGGNSQGQGKLRKWSPSSCGQSSGALKSMRKPRNIVPSRNERVRSIQIPSIATSTNNKSKMAGEPFRSTGHLLHRSTS